MNRDYRIALICGAAPLLTGIGVFLLWLATRWQWLMVAGVYTLFGGLVVFAIGLCALGRYCWLGFHHPLLPRQRFWRSTLGGLGLLLANFPTAAIILATVAAIELP